MAQTDEISCNTATQTSNRSSPVAGVLTETAGSQTEPLQMSVRIQTDNWEVIGSKQERSDLACQTAVCEEFSRNRSTQTEAKEQSQDADVQTDVTWLPTFVAKTTQTSDEEFPLQNIRRVDAKVYSDGSRSAKLDAMSGDELQTDYRDVKTQTSPERIRQNVDDETRRYHDVMRDVAVQSQQLDNRSTKIAATQTRDNTLTTQIEAEDNVIVTSSGRHGIHFHRSDGDVTELHQQTFEQQQVAIASILQAIGKLADKVSSTQFKSTEFPGPSRHPYNVSVFRRKVYYIV